jgi:hypothetical protein
VQALFVQVPSGAMQFPLARHCTQKPPGPQYGLLPPPQVALVVQAATQRCVVVLHAWFAAQLPVARQGTQVLLAVSQYGVLPPHCLSAVHCTQAFVVVLHEGRFVGQLASARHATHVPAGPQ